MDAFIGHWEVTETENVEEMLKALRVGEDIARVMRTSLPKLHYQRDGDQWTMTVVTPVASKAYSFVSGQELDTEGFDGRPVKTRVVIEDNKFVEHYKSEDNVESKVIREIVGQDELLVTIYCGGIKSTAKHKRVI